MTMTSAASGEGLSMEIFRAMYNLYEGQIADGMRYFPGDVENLFAVEAQSQMVERPGMIVPFVLAKYGPHREAILAACEVASRGRNNSPQMLGLSGVEDLYNILVDSLIRMSKISHADLEVWTRNVGRNMRGVGLVNYCRATLGLISKSSGSGETSYCFGKSATAYTITPFSVLTLAQKAKLDSLIGTGRALLEVRLTINVTHFEYFKSIYSNGSVC